MANDLLHNLGARPPTPEHPEPEFATCRGGPCDGLRIRTGREIEWAGIFLDDAGRRIPDSDTEGVVRTLPADPHETTDALLITPRRRWAPYRRVGFRPAGVGFDPMEDLPLPPDGTVVYKWVNDRSTR